MPFNFHPQPLRYARLEKADILEMVVKYLKDLKKRRQAMIAAMEPHLFRSFKMGYLDCTRATIDFINEIESPTERKKKIIDHITQECMTTLKNQYPSTTFTQHHEVIFANVTPPDHFMPYPLLSSFDSSNDMEWLSLEERLGFSPIGRSNFVSHEPKSPTDCLSSIKAEPLLKCSDQQQGQSLVLKDVSLTLEQSVRLEDERHNSSQISDTDSSDNDEEDSDRKLIIDDHNNNHAWRPWL